MNHNDKKEIWEYWEKKSKHRKMIMKSIPVRAYQKLTNSNLVLPKYAGKPVCSRKETNDKIKELVLSKKDEPVMVSRFGFIEMKMLEYYLEDCIYREGKLSEKTKKQLEYLCTNAGFFPYDETFIPDFCKIYIEAAKQIDVLGTWNLYMEQYMIDQYMQDNVILTHLVRLEPWLAKNPWSQALEGKKVLVIHPFTETILSQYKKRELLFENPSVLPKFDLKVLKSVQTIAGEKDNRFKNWFEALEYMFSEAIKIEFDVAIIGCGAYGMALAAKIKKAGRHSIHLGGATQLMFGIKGKRWEKNYKTKIASLFNEAWVYPDKSETPQNAKLVENGCYW